MVALVGALMTLLLLSLLAVPPSGFEQAVIALIDAVPSWFDIVWQLGASALLLWVLVVVWVSAVRRRGDVLSAAALIALIACGAAAVCVWRINGTWPSVSQLAFGGTTGIVPLAALATGAAFVDATGPHLARPYRRCGRTIVGIAAISTVMLGSTTPVGALISLLAASVAAAAVHLAIGTSAGRPTAAQVVESLDALGIVAHDLVAAPRQRGGVVLMDAVDGEGRPLRVKVYGRDARDAQVAAKAWRGLWFRGSAAAAPGRLQQVEHEAFVTMFAASGGVRVPTVVTACRDDRRDSIIVVRNVAEPVSERPRPERADALAGIWQSVRLLHQMGMVHGELTPDSFGVQQGSVTIRDLGPVSLTGADALRQKDLAQTLVTTAVLVGIERSVVVAGEKLGVDETRAMLPYLQPAALNPELRRRLKAEGFDMDALRSAMGAVVDVELPEVAQLRRVSPQSLVTVVLLALVGWALITSLGNVDLSELLDELTSAAPGWLVAALVAGQVPFVAQAVATRGAAPQRVPLGPVALLQSGVAFVALAVPSTAGRLALDIRFFQRQGLPATTAVSIAAIDSFSGFLVQCSLLIATLGFGVGDVQLSFSRSSGGSGGSGNIALILAILGGVVLVGALLALALRRVRQGIVARVRPMLEQVADTVRSLRSPTKLLELFGGNLANQLLFAMALGVCLRAFGGELDLATLLTIYVASALFGGLMPVPGGVGVMEAALTAGLVAGGIATTTAAATAMLFRAVTFYLPPLWGWLSLRWLRHHDYL